MGDDRFVDFGDEDYGMSVYAHKGVMKVDAWCEAASESGQYTIESHSDIKKLRDLCDKALEIDNERDADTPHD